MLTGVGLGTALALVMTVLMGGIIAYNGDLIGRRFGKKRVTMFGLRPRYTAILITSVTGVMISGITTGVLFLLVPSVRDVILRGEQAIAQVSTLKTQIKETSAQAEASENKVAVLNRQVTEQRANLKNVNDEVTRKQKQVDAKEAERVLVTARLAEAQSRLSEAQARMQALTVKNRSIAATNERLTSANTALAQNNLKLATTNANLRQDNEALIKDNAIKLGYNTELVQKNSEISQRNEELTRLNTSLEKQTKDLERTRTVLTRVVDEQRQSAEQYKEQNDRLAADNAKLASENSELKGLIPGYASLRDAYQASRSRRVAVHKDEDLARVVIPAGTDPAGVREYVQTLIRDASEAAKVRGAAVGESMRAVQVVDRQVLEQLPDGQVQTIRFTAEDRIDAVVSKLAWQTVPCALLAIAVTNSVEQEPAGIDLQPLPNRRVYQKGQLVFARPVNGTQGTTGIFNDMVKFLKEMGQSALEQGVIPRMDPLTGEPEVGAMNYSEVVDLVERIRSVGGRVRVRAIADQDLYSADPLKLHFDVMH